MAIDIERLKQNPPESAGEVANRMGELSLAWIPMLGS
jgi:hypothetical protein